jgi:hypothetical protein
MRLSSHRWAIHLSRYLDRPNRQVVLINDSYDSAKEANLEQ